MSYNNSFIKNVIKLLKGKNYNIRKFALNLEKGIEIVAEYI